MRRIPTCWISCLYFGVRSAISVRCNCNSLCRVRFRSSNCWNSDMIAAHIGWTLISDPAQPCVSYQAGYRRVACHGKIGNIGEGSL